jgi:DNA mismatch endonuclease (patch repair protein)
MTDTLSPAERARRMAAIGGKNTRPEMAVRRLAHRLGYRYRLHVGKLPGRPDMVFAARRAVIFVHGCYWHRHPDPACPLARLPKSRLEFWLPKLEGNRARDAAVLEQLAARGWRALTVWECELRDMEAVGRAMMGFLGAARGKPAGP